MKRLIILLAVFLIAGCNQPTTPSSLALTGATVIDVRDGARIADAVVAIDSGRITAVGPVRDTPIPSGARFVDAGFTPLEAVQTATINPAKYLGIEDEAGSVSVGKRADFLVLDADPMENIANTKRISAVVLGGSFIDRTELDGMLTKARQVASETTVK